MNKQYYRLRLDDYAAPSFASWGKSYYGTLDDIRGFVDALDCGSKDHGMSIAELIAAFREYESGNHSVSHHVAYKEVPLLEPVEVFGEISIQQKKHEWEHINTWGCSYRMRCKTVNSVHLWVKTPSGFCRAVLAQLRDLQYECLSGDWLQIECGFWGYPEMIASAGTRVFNRLAVEEKRFLTEEELTTDWLLFPESKDVNLYGVCQDIYGNG